MHLPYPIVVPTDFSAAAAHAYPLAQQMAAAFERPLRLVHVLNPLDAEVTWSPASAEAYLNVRLSELELELSAGGLPVTSTVRRGFAAREILDEVADKTAMVVLGVSGRVGEKHRLFGSVSAKVLRGSPVAVLTVRAPETPEPHVRPIRRVLITLDFSELETGAFDDAAEVARRLGASVDLVHVLRPPELPLVRADFEGIPGVPPVSLAELEQLAGRELERVADRARAMGITLGSVVLREGDPVDTVIDHIHATDPDLVIMSSHGRRGFSRALLGSVTEAVVMRSPRPVLVLKPRQTYLEVVRPSPL